MDKPIEDTSDQLAIAAEIASSLREATSESSRFDELITDYRKLFAKYMQSVSSLPSKTESSSSIGSGADEGVKASKEFKLLLAAFDEQKTKFNNQLTLHNKALGDIIQMRSELDRTEKRVNELKETAKTNRLALAKAERRTGLYKDDIEKYKQTGKDNEALEVKLKELKAANAKSQEDYMVLSQRLKEYVDNLKEKMNQSAADKLIAENAYISADSMFKEKEEKLKSLLKSNVYSKDMPSSSLVSGSSIAIEIPKTLKTKLKAHQKGITSLCFDSLGNSLISSSIDGSIKRWDCTSYAETAVFSNFTSSVSEAAFDHSEQYLFAGSMDKTANLWDLQSGELHHTFTGHNDYINCVHCYPKSIRAITGSSDKTIKEWDFSSSKNTRSIKCNSSCNALSILSDESVIISGHSDGCINIWADNDKPAKSIELHDDKVLHLEVLQDQLQFFSLSKDFTIKLFDIRTMKTVYTITDKVLSQYCESTVSLSSDHRYIAVGSVKGTVFIFNANNGSLAAQFDNKTNSTILAVQWRPGCSELIVGDALGNISLWGAK